MSYADLPAWARLTLLACCGLALLALAKTYEEQYGRPRWLARLVGGKKEK